MTSFAPVLVTPPASSLVSLAETKAHLRVEHAEEDALIQGMIDAATSHLDGYHGRAHRALVTQTWRQDFAEFCDKLRLPLHPVASVSSVTYIDTAGVQQTLASTEWQLLADERGGYVATRPGKFWPALGDAVPAVSVTYIAGQSASDVPKAIKQAMLLIIGDWHRNRETVAMAAGMKSIPSSGTVDALLAPFRRSFAA